MSSNSKPQSPSSFQPRTIEEYIEDFDFELDSKIKAEEDIVKLQKKIKGLELEIEKFRQQEVESKEQALRTANTLREMGLSDSTIVTAVLAELKSKYKKINRPTIFSVEEDDIVAFIKSRKEDGASIKDLAEVFFDINRQELNSTLKELLSHSSIWVTGTTRKRRYWAT